MKAISQIQIGARALASVIICTLMCVMMGASTAFAVGGSCQGAFAERKKLPVATASELAFYEAEFSRQPDDRLNGQITDKVPMNVPSLLAAYRRGIFPWDVSPEGNIIWFSPPRRGVLFLENLKWGHEDNTTLKDLYKKLANGTLRVTVDTSFERLMRACAAQPRPMRDPSTGLLTPGVEKTWITEDFIEAYVAMHEAGYGHSIEVWEGNELVGGTYGVMIDGVFTGESMFHTKKNVAKLAFDILRAHLLSRGVRWVDTQVAPYDSKSLTVKWGAFEAMRAVYAKMLALTQPLGLTWGTFDIEKHKKRD